MSGAVTVTEGSNCGGWLAHQNLAAFREECLLLMGLHHPNVIQFMGGCWSTTDANICSSQDVHVRH